MYQKGYHNTNVAIRVSSQRAAFASYIFFFDPAHNFVLYDRNYPWTYTSFHIFTNISQHSLFSFWVILSDFSDIVNLFYYDLTIFSAAAVWSCPEGFLLHRGFHRNFLWNKNKIESRIRNDQIHFRILLSIFIISVYTVLLFLMQAITRLLQNKKDFNHLKSFFMPQTGIEPVLDLTRTGF